MSRTIIDLSGQEINNLIVTNEFERHEIGKRKRIFWKCKCKLCNSETWKVAHLLKKGVFKDCGCKAGRLLSAKSRLKSKKSWIGKKINYYKILDVYLDEKYRKYIFKCLCTKCNETIVEKPLNLLRQSMFCIECFRKKNNESDIIIPYYYFVHIQRNAKTRNLEFSVSREYCSNLLEKQKYKCALSGEPIFFTDNSILNRGKHTASLDRIDSTKGYIEGNLQWVHKKINIMKTNLTDEQFWLFSKKVYFNLKDRYDGIVSENELDNILDSKENYIIKKPGFMIDIYRKAKEQE